MNSSVPEYCPLSSQDIRNNRQFWVHMHHLAGLPPIARTLTYRPIATSWLPILRRSRFEAHLSSESLMHETSNPRNPRIQRARQPMRVHAPHPSHQRLHRLVRRLSLRPFRKLPISDTRARPAGRELRHLIAGTNGLDRGGPVKIEWSPASGFTHPRVAGHGHQVKLPTCEASLRNSRLFAMNSN